MDSKPPIPVPRILRPPLAYFISFLWGIAEATLFFIVPDVFISFVGLVSVRRGLWACVYAVAGALVGGAIMYLWGQADLDGVRPLLVVVPAIHTEDLNTVQQELLSIGAPAVFLGPLSGVPYKIYAAHAHLISGLLLFLLISIPARGLRFVLMATIPAVVARWIGTRLSFARKIQLLGLFWVVFYIGFFIVKG